MHSVFKCNLAPAHTHTHTHSKPLNCWVCTVKGWSVGRADTAGIGWEAGQIEPPVSYSCGTLCCADHVSLTISLTGLVLVRYWVIGLAQHSALAPNSHLETHRASNDKEIRDTLLAKQNRLIHGCSLWQGTVGPLSFKVYVLCTHLHTEWYVTGLKPKTL